MPVKVGDRVRVTALWSEFWGQDGRVTQVEPCVMVLLDEYESSIRIDLVSLGVHPVEAVP